MQIAATAKTIGLAAALATLCGTAYADRTVKTTAGTAVIIGHHSDTGDSCGGSMPSIDIVTPPAHGKTEIKPGRYVLTSAFAGKTDCIGHEVDGAMIWYTPAAGYTGTDTVTYAVNYKGKRRTTLVNQTVNLTVK